MVIVQIYCDSGLNSGKLLILLFVMRVLQYFLKSSGFMHFFTRNTDVFLISRYITNVRTS